VSIVIATARDGIAFDSEQGLNYCDGNQPNEHPGTALGAVVRSLARSQRLFLLLLHRHRHQVRNQDRRMSGIDVHCPYLCQRHHRRYSLDKFLFSCLLLLLLLTPGTDSQSVAKRTRQLGWKI
jgi:hypothetical protein